MKKKEEEEEKVELSSIRIEISQRNIIVAERIIFYTMLDLFVIFVVVCQGFEFVCFPKEEKQHETGYNEHCHPVEMTEAAIAAANSGMYLHEWKCLNSAAPEHRTCEETRFS